MKLNGLISRARVCELLSYDPATGVFTRINSPQKWRNGRQAGSSSPKGTQILVDGVVYLAHRLAWLIMTGDWPSSLIDHGDGNPLNNAWSNLRLATKELNKANGRLARNNTSGFKGAALERSTGRWNSYIRAGGKQMYLGTFDTAQEAGAAYEAAARLHFGEFARVA